MALTTVLSHNILIVSSADGANDHFTVIVEPNGNVASNDVPLLLGHCAENYFLSLDIASNGMYDIRELNCPVIYLFHSF